MFHRKKILVIATGGTIACKQSKNGLMPPITSDELLEFVPEVTQICDVETVQLFNIDSTNVGPDVWLKVL